MNTDSQQAPSSNGKIQVGDRVPDFTLPTQKTGISFHLHDMLGKSAIVLFFYPKDNTPGCTAEACSFRDNYEVFKEAGAEVIGVSSDTEESHQQFASQHQLPFILLSDKNGAIRKKYGVPTTLGLLPGRVTYIIDKEGVVRHIFSSQLNINKHVSEAIRVLQEITH
ncbi:MAG: peroxiredoxin [Ktedonobacteraceae bacterium]|nr:peroxiredoxin [Ktedonobacteraceae bacterium]MBO0791698.1 peroxiredoxin [Ktedonobacteraceae bacterium]